MRFWDTSAVVPLLIQESQSERVAELLGNDPSMQVWVFTRVECYSAFFRQQRISGLSLESLQQFRTRLAVLSHSWIEVIQTELVCNLAERILAHHPLRAADALQLAAALVGCDERPEGVEFVTFDQTLALAAAKEGFSVVYQ